MFREYNVSKSVSVGTSNVVLSEERGDDERTFMSIVNTSTGGQSISIAFGQEAIAGTGIVLYAGGFYSESREAGFKMNQKNVCAIASAAGASVAVQERVSMRSVTP